MKKDKLLLGFIIFIAAGLLLINFVFKEKLINKNTLSYEGLSLSLGYKAQIALKGLNSPTSFFIDSDNSIYAADNLNGYGRIIKYTPDGKFSIIAKDLLSPVSQIIKNKEIIYISQRGKISKLEDGKITDIVDGLPSYGDNSNNGIAIGYDGMIYICQGSATNSGVVGTDNYEKGWLYDNPYFHDYPPLDTILSGINYKSDNPFTSLKNDRANTGGFLPFNTSSKIDEVIKGRLPGNACILKVAPNGSAMELFAAGLSNPTSIVMQSDGSAYVSNQGMKAVGARPIENGCDYIYEVNKGMWLGWPDYEGGEVVTLLKFKAKYANTPKLLTLMHPDTNPKKPLVSFTESGRIGIIDICKSSSFGMKGQIFIPLKKGEKQPAKIVAYDIKNNISTDFMVNKEGDSTLLEPVQCSFSKDGKLYILEKSSGVILKIEKQQEVKNNIRPLYIPIEYFIGLFVISLIVFIFYSLTHNK